MDIVDVQHRRQVPGLDVQAQNGTGQTGGSVRGRQGVGAASGPHRIDGDEQQEMGIAGFQPAGGAGAGLGDQPRVGRGPAGGRLELRVEGIRVERGRRHHRGRGRGHGWGGRRVRGDVPGFGEGGEAGQQAQGGRVARHTAGSSAPGLSLHSTSAAVHRSPGGEGTRLDGADFLLRELDAAARRQLAVDRQHARRILRRPRHRLQRRTPCLVPGERVPEAEQQQTQIRRAQGVRPCAAYRLGRQAGVEHSRGRDLQSPMEGIAVHGRVDLGR
ncbi:hypothetical protein [Embleya sp. NBC_00896]|uniref:hypothetical protein n=1 Tax=Embleya sp. NBC_00896 TaxID=2975961 RepID=UPI00386F9E16|nr:hypothetical protein OG928_47970 [Embleya sp. NBC_00896]